MLRNSIRFGWTLGVVLGVLLISSVFSTTAFGTYFTGTVSNDWAVAGNWNGGLTPSTDSSGTQISGNVGALNVPCVLSSTDSTASLNVGTWGSAGLSIATGANLTVTGGISVGTPIDGYTGAGTITQTGGAVVGNSSFTLADWSGGAGSAYNISGGSASFTGGSSRILGVRSSASMSVSGAGELTIGSNYGTYFAIAGAFGEYGVATGVGTSTLSQSGGTVNLQSTLSALRLGDGATAVGIYDLTGGTLNLATNVQNMAVGTGYLKLNGGTLNFTGATIDVDHLQVGTEASGSWALTSGQTLTAGDLALGSSTSTGILDVLGGTANAGNLLFSGSGSKVRLGDNQILDVLQANYTVSAALADVSAGRVDAYTSGSSVAVSTVNIGGVDYTQLQGVPVPEPSTIVLLTTALLGLLAYAWRKRK